MSKSDVSPSSMGKPYERPIRGNNPVPLNQVRNEMRRLMGIMLQLNDSFLKREKYVRHMHERGHQNFSGDISTVLDKDIILGNISGGSKTVSTLIQGCSAYILAELAMHQHALRNGKYGDEVK